MHKITKLFGVLALTAGCMQEPDTLATSTPASTQAEASQATPPSASSNTVEVTVDSSFAGVQFAWNSNGAETFIRYRPVIQDGQMYICGAYTNRGGSIFNRLGRQAVTGATIEMNGSTVLRGLQFFSIVSNANRGTQLVGTTARCRNTGLSPSEQELSTVQINVRRGQYRIQK